MTDEFKRDGDPSGDGSDFGNGRDNLRTRIAALKAEVAKLREENARLRAVVRLVGNVLSSAFYNPVLRKAWHRQTCFVRVLETETGKARCECGFSQFHDLLEKLAAAGNPCGKL